MKVKIADIEANLSINARSKLNQDTIDSYAEIFDQLPPVVVFDLGELGAYLLADGFHRVEAAKKLGREEIELEIKEGNRKDTKIYALSANAKRGLPLTRAETREATKALLRECTERSDSWIAEDMGISKNTVDKYRAELESACQIDTLEKLIGKDGKEYPRKIKQPSWRDNASDTLLRCVDANVFSKDVGKALIKYPLEAQDVIAKQIEQMEERPPSSKILDWIQKFEEIDDELLVAFMRGALRIKYFDDIYQLWNAEEEETGQAQVNGLPIHSPLMLIDLIGEHDRQFVAFDPVYKEAYCVTSHDCIIKGGSDYETTKNYHPVMRMMEGSHLVCGGSSLGIYRMSFRQPFLNDDAAYSALLDEGIRIKRDFDFEIVEDGFEGECPEGETDKEGFALTAGGGGNLDGPDPDLYDSEAFRTVDGYLKWIYHYALAMRMKKDLEAVQKIQVRFKEQMIMLDEMVSQLERDLS